MYREHFGLEVLPFKITPDPAFLCETSQNRRALNMLRSEIAQSYPINVVTGEVGTGKTTLILHLLKNVPENVTIGLLSNFPSWAEDIMPWVLYTFDIPNAADDVTRNEAFETFVKTEYSAGRQCILIVDEAQNVSDQGLEQLRRLVNVNTGKEIQFTLILVGQAELCDRLQSPAHTALAQRVGVSVTLGPMNAEETAAYVRHRLTVAGGRADIFDREAIAAIHEGSGGYPRVVNVMCDTALVLAYGAGETHIGKDAIESLGGEDGVLSHLPEVSDLSSRKAPVKEPADGKEPGFAEVKGDHLRRDVFEFVAAPRVEAEREPVAEATPAPQVEEPREKAEPQEDTVIPPSFLEPARTPAEHKGAKPSKTRRERKARRRAEHRQATQGREKPGERRVGYRGLLGGTLVASMVAAGAYFMGPFEFRAGQVTEPVDMVSVQSVSSLAPAGLSRVEQEVPEPLVPLADEPGEKLLNRAIDAGVTDPSAAAVDYARAALRGETLAAYYLGQLYEAGDGVPRDLALARSWYTSVEEEVRGARRRLKDLGDPDRDGDLAAPRPLLGATLDTGGAEFVWASGEGADPAFFVVELSAGPDQPARRLQPQTTSALKVESVGDARLWRVFAVAPGMHRYAVSGWTRLEATGSPTPGRTDEVAPEAVVQLPSGTEPGQLAAVTDVLSASRIRYRVEHARAGAANADSLRIGYFFDRDELAARKIADVVGASSAVMIADAGGPDRPYPFPGQVVIYSADP